MKTILRELLLITGGDLVIKPGAGVGPVVLGGARGDVEQARRLFNRQADKIAQFHQLGLDRILRREFIDGLIDCQELVVSPRGGEVNVFHIYPELSATVTQSALLSSSIDQN